MNMQRATSVACAAMAFSLLPDHFVVGVVGQERPYYTPTLLDPDANYRQNLCDRHQKFYTGEVELRNSLHGLELRPLLDIYDDQIFSLEEGKIKEENPGLIVDLMDELARRAGFTWRNSFGVIDVTNGLGEDATWTDLLLWGVNSFDVHVDWWIPAIARLKLGVGFPRGFYDASFILVGRKDESIESDSINLFNWLTPFEPFVWWVTLFTILASAVIYIMLEKLNPEGEDVLSFSRGLFVSLLLFNQHCQFTPKSHAARLFIASMAFWSLIIITTYTANLASLFVLENTPHIPINSIDDAIRATKRICVWKGTGSADYVTKKFPKGIFIEKVFEEETLLGVKDDECEFALMSFKSWEQLSKDEIINDDCNLAWIGRIVKSVDAGFGVKNDAGVFCTGLLYDVLNLHLMEMDADGFIDKAWEDSDNFNKSQSCDSKVDSSQDHGDSMKLDLEDMAGTFFLHFLAAVLSLVVTVISKFTSKRTVSKSTASEEGTNILAPVSTGAPVDVVQMHNPDETKILLDIQEEIKKLRNQHSEHSKQTAKLVSLLEIATRNASGENPPPSSSASSSISSS